MSLSFGYLTYVAVRAEMRARTLSLNCASVVPGVLSGASGISRGIAITSDSFVRSDFPRRFLVENVPVSRACRGEQSCFVARNEKPSHQ